MEQTKSGIKCEVMNIDRRSQNLIGILDRDF